MYQPSCLLRCCQGKPGELAKKLLSKPQKQFILYLGTDFAGPMKRLTLVLYLLSATLLRIPLRLGCIPSCVRSQCLPPYVQFRNRFPHPSLIILYIPNLPTIYGICVGDFEVGLCLLPKPRSETSSHVTISSAAAFPVQIQSSQFSSCVGNTFGKSPSFPDSLDPGLVLLARVHLEVAALQLGPEHGQLHRVNHLEGGQVLDGAQLVAVQEQHL